MLASFTGIGLLVALVVLLWEGGEVEYLVARLSEASSWAALAGIAAAVAGAVPQYSAACQVVGTICGAVGVFVSEKGKAG